MRSLRTTGLARRTRPYNVRETEHVTIELGIGASASRTSRSEGCSELAFHLHRNFESCSGNPLLRQGRSICLFLALGLLWATPCQAMPCRLPSTKHATTSSDYATASRQGQKRGCSPPTRTAPRPPFPPWSPFDRRSPTFKQDNGGVRDKVMDPLHFAPDGSNNPNVLRRYSIRHHGNRRSAPLRPVTEPDPVSYDSESESESGTRGGRRLAPQPAPPPRTPSPSASSLPPTYQMSPPPAPGRPGTSSTMATAAPSYHTFDQNPHRGSQEGEGEDEDARTLRESMPRVNPHVPLSRRFLNRLRGKKPALASLSDEEEAEEEEQEGQVSRNRTRESSGPSSSRSNPQPTTPTEQPQKKYSIFEVDPNRAYPRYRR